MRQGIEQLEQLQGKELRQEIEELVEPAKMANKSAENLLDEIGDSKKAGPARLIFALGIRFVGERTGQLLAAHFGSLKSLSEAKLDELAKVEEVGPNVVRGS